MNIDFTGPVMPLADGGVSFRAVCDGQKIACWFSWEALQDVDPRQGQREPIEQFEASREQLLGMARDKIERGSMVNGVVEITRADFSY